MKRSTSLRRRILCFLSVTCLVAVLLGRCVQDGADGISVFRGSTTAAKDAPAFPNWNDKRGIAIDELLAFILAVSRKLASTVTSTKTRARFPETLYVMDRAGAWASKVLRQRTWKMMVEARLKPTEHMMQTAWNFLDDMSRQSPESIRNRWPALARAVWDGSGLPFLVWYGDYKACNYQNWGNRSIPLFTTAAPIACQYAWPMPNYKSIKASQKSRSDWKTVMADYKSKYPWDRKLSKVVWRGSLSAANDDLQSVRWRLCRLATESQSPVLDVGLVSMPSRNDHLNLSWSDVGGQASSIPQVDFQKYVAIIDVDGNSWSSRFGELLCYNSVVLKVEPAFVEYFYPDLQPWVHYIPVQGDLTDLVKLSEYALDPRNNDTIQGIIQRANAWCASHLVLDSLATDFLDLLNVYATHLERGDAQWNKQWTTYKDTIFSHPAFDMEHLQLVWSA
jgi:hypothetical protein